MRLNLCRMWGLSWADLDRIDVRRILRDTSLVTIYDAARPKNG